MTRTWSPSARSEPNARVTEGDETVARALKRLHPVGGFGKIEGAVPNAFLLETLARLQSKSAIREIPEEHHVGRRGVAGVTMRIALKRAVVANKSSARQLLANGL